MSEPLSNENGAAAGATPPERRHSPELLEFQRRMAELGMQVRLGRPDPGWELPEPVDLDGLSLGDMVVRLRRCGP